MLCWCMPWPALLIFFCFFFPMCLPLLSIEVCALLSQYKMRAGAVLYRCALGGTSHKETKLRMWLLEHLMAIRGGLGMYTVQQKHLDATVVC